MVKYLNDKFYTEVKNEKYVIHEGKIFRETFPKSLKTQYELIHDMKVPKGKIVNQLETGELVLIDKNSTTS